MVFQQKNKVPTKKEKSPSQTREQSSASPLTTLQRATAHPASLSPAHVLQLQQTIGNRAVSQLFALQRNPVIQRKIDGSHSKLYEEMQQFKNFPKKPSKSFNSLISTIYGELKSSPNDYSVDEIARLFSGMGFDEGKIAQWRETDFLDEQRTALDHDVLYGENAHGGQKHLGLTKKEQKKRLLDDDKPRGTSVKVNKESLSFISKVKDTLHDSLTAALTQPCWSLLEELQGSANQRDLKTLAGNLNGTEFATDDYKLSFQFSIQNFNNGNVSFNLTITPELKSTEDFEITDYTVSSKTHFKTKEVKKQVNEAGEAQKQLAMFWGRQKIIVPFEILDTEGTILEKLAAAVHGGVTLF